MFDVSWSELLILGIVTLVFVGPKELPALMRTLGKYAGMARRHANEFKLQFDAAMQQAEIDAMREEVEKMQASINDEVMRASASVDEAGKMARIDASAPAAPAVTVSSGEAASASSQPMPPMPAPPRGEA